EADPGGVCNGRGPRPRGRGRAVGGGRARVGVAAGGHHRDHADDAGEELAGGVLRRRRANPSPPKIRPASPRTAPMMPTVSAAVPMLSLVLSDLAATVGPVGTPNAT